MYDAYMVTDDLSLIVTAHPDDETLFFAGLILSRPKTRWHVICVTDGNADGQGQKRRNDFKNACRDLGVQSHSWLGLPDIFEQRLDIEKLRTELATFHPKEVFTHGILGEYGHPHHQDVSYATHLQFEGLCPVTSVAYNCQPEWVVNLDPFAWSLKSRILTTHYLTETQRFYNFLPITFTEGFVTVDTNEVRALYSYLTKNSPLNSEALKVYKPIAHYLKARHPLDNRPF